MTTFKVVCMHIFPNSLPCFIPLHSNMFLLIRQAQQSATAHQRALHSNMFLLIPARISPVITTGSVFTFQYVSINTMDAEESSIPIVTLHSNMFLLIRKSHVCMRKRPAFTFQYVSINTLLRLRSILGSNVFTFQYVSINTAGENSQNQSDNRLYIPICFY